MRVSEVIENGKSLLNQQVRIEGLFVFVGSHGYLVDSIEERDNLSNAVRVSLDNLKRVVSSRVPPFGGGKYYYSHSAALHGRLEKSDIEEFAFQCAGIDSFEIDLADHHFVVVP